MGNKVSQKYSYNLREKDDLNNFLGNINMLDGFYMDTCMSISSKCLVIINNLMNDGNNGTVKLMSGIDVEPDNLLTNKIHKLKFHCGLIKHLSVVNSAMETVEELVELNNMLQLTSLTLDHVPIRYVQHLKKHRQTLLKLSVHHSLDNAESLIDLCGGDYSFPDKWNNLLHLDMRYNQLRSIGPCVMLLVSLTVLDISRNDIEDLSFIHRIPTLACLNASFNHIRSLPKIFNTRLRVLILAYNYLDGLEGINGFKYLSTLNVSFNMIATNDYLQQLKEMDFLKDLVLRGNPLFYSQKYRLDVLDIVSPRVSINFAIDGKCLTKTENAYLHKRPMIVIAPALSPTTEVYKEVPIIIAKRNDLCSDATNSDSQSNSYNKRNIKQPIIIDRSEIQSNTIPNEYEHRNSNARKEPEMNSLSNTIQNENEHPLLRNSNARKEPKMNSLFEIDTFVSSFTVTDSIMIVEKDSFSYIEDSTNCCPYYVGNKSSNFFIVVANKPWISFVHVSIQIIEHKLMVVDELDVIVDNTDLWALMATTSDTLHQESDSGNVLKLIFFFAINGANNDQISLCTKTVEFAEPEEMKTFLEQLSHYLHGFSISYDNWTSLPLLNVSLICTKCYSLLSTRKDMIRPYCCPSCSGTRFMIQGASVKSNDSPILNNSSRQNIQILKEKASTMLSPASKKVYTKLSTSNLVIRTLGSTESLARMKEDKDILDSDDTSFYSAINGSSNFESSRSLFSNLNGLNDGGIDSSLECVTPNNELEEHDEIEEIFDKVTKLNLDVPISINMLQMEDNIMPHECDKVRDTLKSALRTPWVVYEPSCDIKLHMHNNNKIDDRVKLYFLTKVMQDKEDLLAVFKVYLSYRSTGVTTTALVVLSELRIIIFNLLDKVSSSMNECLKLVHDFPLTSLQQLEYCLNTQWLELQFKGKPIVTFLIGDSDSVKDIGSLIVDAISRRSTNFLLTFSRELSKLKQPQILSELTSDINDGVTMETLNMAESYLIKSANVFLVTEKSHLEYAPKMVIIEAKHLFFITITYSGKGHQPVYELCHTIGLLSVKNDIIIDSANHNTLRLIIYEASENKSVDITFISPRTRSKAVFAIERMLHELFRVDIVISVQDLTADNAP